MENQCDQEIENLQEEIQRLKEDIHLQKLLLSVVHRASENDHPLPEQLLSIVQSNV